MGREIERKANHGPAQNFRDRPRSAKWRGTRAGPSRNAGALSREKLTLRCRTDNNLANVNIGRLLDCERNRTSDRIR